MNRRIPNGAWCLFRATSESSPGGSLALVSHAEIFDPDMGGHSIIRVVEGVQSMASGTKDSRRVRLLPESGILDYAESVPFRIMVPRGREHVADEILRKL